MLALERADTRLGFPIVKNRPILALIMMAQTGRLLRI